MFLTVYKKMLEVINIFSYYIRSIFFRFRSKGKLVFISFYRVYLNSNDFMLIIFKRNHNKKF